MMWPPSILRLRFRNRDHRFGLWLPLFLVWPLILAIALVLAPIFLVSAVVLWPFGWGKPLLFAGPAIARCICSLRGLEINVKQRSEDVFISFR